MRGASRGGFRGGDRGGRGGGFRGGGDRGGRGGSRGGFGGGARFVEPPPTSVIPVGTFMHACKDEMVIKCSLKGEVPFFNTPAFTKEIAKIGQIEEIFGPVNEVMFSVKPEAGIVASSMKEGDIIYINPVKVLPLARFTNEESSRGGGAGRGRGGGPSRGAFRGGRGAPRGGGGFRGGGRGGPRGGGFSRGAPRGGGGFRGRGN